MEVTNSQNNKELNKKKKHHCSDYQSNKSFKFLQLLNYQKIEDKKQYQNKQEEYITHDTRVISHSEMS